MTAREARLPATTPRQRGCCAVVRLERPPQDAGLLRALKALANPTRLQIVGLLAQQQEPLCVCDIVATFHLEQPTISHHLRVLRQAGLVDCYKQGLWCFYSVRSQAVQQVAAALAQMAR